MKVFVEMKKGHQWKELNFSTEYSEKEITKITFINEKYPLVEVLLVKADLESNNQIPNDLSPNIKRYLNCRHYKIFGLNTLTLYQFIDLIDENQENLSVYAVKELLDMVDYIKDTVRKSISDEIDTDDIRIIYWYEDQEEFSWNNIRGKLSSKKYLTLPAEEVFEIAQNNFKYFDNDELKIKFLTKWFEAQDKDQLSTTPEECAKVLVESGTFEGKQ